jgi:hypothetical protein
VPLPVSRAGAWVLCRARCKGCGCLMTWGYLRESKLRLRFAQPCRCGGAWVPEPIPAAWIRRIESNWKEPSRRPPSYVGKRLGRS